MATEQQASKEEPGVVDIDPAWYPGQPETSGTTPDNHVPTVLTKLQKWGDYKPLGTPVYPTKFVPMKTPLSKSILEHWSLSQQPKYRLTVPELVEEQAKHGRKVGLILDLSNHDCLYTEDIPKDIRYTHIQLVAKELPPQEFVDEVIAVACAFWKTHPKEYIAIHCAYGFNRTGFVVCCFLIEECGLSVEDALTSFTDARPPGVKHEQFRQELHRRYGQGRNLPFSCDGADDNSSLGCSPMTARQLSDTLDYAPSPLSLPAAPSAQESILASLPSVDETSDELLRSTCSSQPSASGRRLHSRSPSFSFTAASDVSYAENESLGLTERTILQSFRINNQQQHSTPAHLNIVSSATQPIAISSTNSSPSNKFTRVSLNDINWGSDSEAQNSRQVGELQQELSDVQIAG